MTAMASTAIVRFKYTVLIIFVRGNSSISVGKNKNASTRRISTNAGVQLKLWAIPSVGITNMLMGGTPWRAIASLENFLGGPLWEGPHFCKFCITPTTDFHNGRVNKSCARESQTCSCSQFRSQFLTLQA